MSEFPGLMSEVPGLMSEVPLFYGRGSSVLRARSSVL